MSTGQVIPAGLPGLTTTTSAEIKQLGYWWTAISAVLTILYPSVLLVGNAEQRVFYIVMIVFGSLSLPFFVYMFKYRMAKVTKLHKVEEGGAYAFKQQMIFLAMCLYVGGLYNVSTFAFMAAGYAEMHPGGNRNGSATISDTNSLVLYIFLGITLVLEVVVGILLQRRYHQLADSAAESMRKQEEIDGLGLGGQEQEEGSAKLTGFTQEVGASGRVRKNKSFKDIIDKAMAPIVWGFAATACLSQLVTWVAYFLTFSYTILLVALALMALSSYGTYEIATKHFDLIASAAEMRLRSYEMARDCAFIWTATFLGNCVTACAIYWHMDPGFLKYACCELPAEDGARFWTFAVFGVALVGFALRIQLVFDAHAEKVNDFIEHGITQGVLPGDNTPGELVMPRGNPGRRGTNINISANGDVSVQQF